MAHTLTSLVCLFRSRQRGASAFAGLALKPSFEGLEDRSVPTVGLVSANAGNTDSANTGSTFSNMSADGRYVVFQSAATNIVSGIPDRTGGGGDIFVRDRKLNKTTLVTINRFNNATANYSSMNPIISGNGRFVLFESLASDLTFNSTNNVNHHANVFVRDLLLKKTTMVSVNTSGNATATATSTVSDSPQTNGRFISDDGRYIVFQSDAANLVANDHNFQPDVFLRDRVLNKTFLVSINAAGTAAGSSRSDHAVVSTDGRYVAFDSNARDLVPGVTDFSFHRKVFVRDMTLRKTLLASTNSSGGPDVSDDSFLPKISANGQVVVFSSFAKLANADTNFSPDIYVRKLSLSRPTLVSAAFNGGGANAGSYEPVISDNGLFVAFESLAGNLTRNDTDGDLIANKDVFVRNLTTDVTTLVSAAVGNTRSGNFESRAAAISGDGRFVAFESRATNIMAGLVVFHDSIFDFDIFLRDTLLKKTTLVTAAFGSTTHAGNNGSRFPVISRNGRFVSFHSLATDLVRVDTNGSGVPHGGVQTDVFVSSAFFF